MLSQMKTLTASALLLGLATATPASAQQGPVTDYCESIKKDIIYYYELAQAGGTARQLEVWNRLRLKHIRRFNNSRCINVSSQLAAYQVLGIEKSAS